ncbi:hypothetical protein CERZMDRAFT_80877 [Cercospora zeae-maydis SCOH1-5]|uniref:Uncharacterized protein n=1 Tax=Cercospora zeae-maydis SCOH1-5 TaxID=717836 RepID=A0A6A6FTU1_9PEZI|nr:hypothetical protein CERZMDRAFT_80877 [Cercospora zeae-maydis SCOH1-5]
MSQDYSSFLDLWDWEQSDITQWQRIFDGQAREAEEVTTQVAGENGINAHESAAEADAATHLEVGIAHSVGQGFLDPALFLDSSDVPLPSVEQNKSASGGHGTMRSPTEQAQQATHTDSTTRPPDNDLQNFSANVYGYVQWPNNIGSIKRDYVSDPSVGMRQGPAPTADMRRDEMTNNEKEVESTTDPDQLQQIIDPAFFQHDLHHLMASEYNKDAASHTQPNNDTMLDWPDLPAQHASYHHFDTVQQGQPYPQGYRFDDAAITQLPDHNLHLAYRNQSLSNEPTQHGHDSSFSPEPAYSPDLFSPTPGPSEFSPEPERKSKRSRSTTTRNPNTIVMKTSVNCVAPGCGRPFRNRTHVLDLCNRCARKHDRHTAEAQPNNLDPSVPNMAIARSLIYPSQPGRGPPVSQDELAHILSHEDDYIQRLLDAVNFVVPGGEGGNSKAPGLSWETRQQITFNQKLRMEGTSHKGAEGLYRRSLLTARLRALFLELHQFHTGTQESFYAIGGNNAGYNPDTSMTFQERFESVREFLRTNKRMVMDVVEGRGVKSIVANPKGYNKRKVSNNACNEDKKEIMGMGKERMGSVGLGGEGKGKGIKKRRRGGVEDAGGEDAAGASRGSKRVVTRSVAAAAAENSANAVTMDEELFETRLREALNAVGSGWDASRGGASSGGFR